MRQIADTLEVTAKTLQPSDATEILDKRQELFNRDAALLADRTPADIRRVENWRLGRTTDAAVLEFLIGGDWHRYLIDIVSAANLIVQIRDAVDANFHRGSGAVH